MKALVFSIKKIKRTNQRVTWTEDEDRVLISFTNPSGKNRWKKLSQLLPGKTAYDCLLRYRSIKPGLRKGTWEKGEDKILLEGIKRLGKQWSQIARCCFKDRTPKQIRDRYTNYLNPTIRKGTFEESEDLSVIQLYRRFGPKWTVIQRHMPFRSADAIKNRFNSSIKRNNELLAKLNFYQTTSVSSLVTLDIQSITSSEFSVNVDRFEIKPESQCGEDLFDLNTYFNI
jgi:hypothetical protein